ncbi:MAG: UbiA family prenyltransferase [Acidobacteriales bacterium]|nr:UbiA family prenyltransferase [Terriglobales bacterium]
MIKWEHSVFALPFALCGALLAANGIPSGRTIFWIVICMITARTAAMAFNRLVDVKFDAANPRTSSRALPAGALTPRFVAAFTLIFSVMFVLAAAQLNRATLLLSPVALFILLGYSYTKRFTRWSHFVLGFALGIAPTAAWIAVRGTLDWRILLLTAAVTFWVGGFDIIYACQDYDFDSRSGLWSLPCKVGIRNALTIARVMHFLMLLMLVGVAVLFSLNYIALIGVIAVAALLMYEHSLVAADDLSRLNAAFFTMNGVISVVFFVFIAAAVLVR